MKSFLLTSVLALIFTFFGYTQNRDIKIPVATSTTAMPEEAVATFAEGCFWHGEIIFQSLKG